MKNKLRNVLLIGAATFLLQSGLYAQSPQTMNEDIKNNRKNIISAIMEFTPEVSEKFWPVYYDFRSEMEDVNDRAKTLMTDFSQTYATLSNGEAKTMLKDFFDIQKDKLAINKKYANKFNNIMSDHQVLKYYQLENKMDAIGNFLLATGVPVVDWSEKMRIEPKQPAKK